MPRLTKKAIRSGRTDEQTLIIEKLRFKIGNRILTNFKWFTTYEPNFEIKTCNVVLKWLWQQQKQERIGSIVLKSEKSDHPCISEGNTDRHL